MLTISTFRPFTPYENAKFDNFKADEDSFKRFLTEQAFWYDYIKKLQAKLHRNYSPVYVGLYGLNTNEILEIAVEDNVISEFDKRFLRHYIHFNSF